MAERPDGLGLGTVLLAAAGALLLSGVALLAWRSAGGGYPQLPRLAVFPMLAYAALVLYAAWRVRRYVRQDSRTLAARFVPTPQQARGTLVAAQAGALGGALLVGFYLANAVVHLNTLDVPSVRALFVRALVCAGAALVVCVAGLLGQWMCRLPPDENDRPGGADGFDGDGVAYS